MEPKTIYQPIYININDFFNSNLIQYLKISEINKIYSKNEIDLG